MHRFLGAWGRREQPLLLPRYRVEVCREQYESVTVVWRSHCFCHVLTKIYNARHSEVVGACFRIGLEA
jgi:hypothetical protein